MFTACTDEKFWEGRPAPEVAGPSGSGAHQTSLEIHPKRFLSPTSEPQVHLAKSPNCAETTLRVKGDSATVAEDCKIAGRELQAVRARREEALDHGWQSTRKPRATDTPCLGFGEGIECLVIQEERSSSTVPRYAFAIVWLPANDLASHVLEPAEALGTINQVGDFGPRLLKPLVIGALHVVECTPGQFD